MKKLLTAGIGFILLSSAFQANAGPSIQQVIDSDYASGYFNCAYKGKTASKKCLVSSSYISSSVDRMTKRFYGPNEQLPLLTIKWPDGDTSRYVYLDSGEMMNLANKQQHRYKTSKYDEFSPDFSRGYIIEGDYGKEHVRLW